MLMQQPKGKWDGDKGLVRETQLVHCLIIDGVVILTANDYLCVSFSLAPVKNYRKIHDLKQHKFIILELTYEVSLSRLKIKALAGLYFFLEALGFLAFSSF